MRRTTGMAALAAAMMLAGAGSMHAQSADSVRPPRPRREMMDDSTAGERRAPADGFRRGPRMRGGAGRVAPDGGFGPGMRRGGGTPGGALLRGITLSEEQQKALRAERARHLAALKPLQVEMVAARADAQIADASGDQRALDAARARLEAAREKLHALTGERSPAAGLRAVLTPEQQNILDRNLAEMVRRPARNPGDGVGGGRRGLSPGGHRHARPGAGARGVGPRERRPRGPAGGTR